MKPLPLPHGLPGQRLGIAHTLKHWLSPSEMWEDLASDLPAAVRPRPTWQRLREAGIDPCVEAGAPGPALQDLWNSLQPVHREGYQQTITRLCSTHMEPPHAPWWHIPERDHWMAHVGDGVLVRVSRNGAGWALWSSFRGLDFRLNDYSCPPQDAASVSLRMKLAVLGAQQRIASRTRGGSE